MPNRRPVRLPLFRSRSPLGISSRYRFLTEALSLRKMLGCVKLFLIVSATTSLCLIIVLSQALPPRSPKSENTAGKSRFCCWTPHPLRPEAHSHSFSSLTYLPDPELSKLDDSRNSRQQFFLHNEEHDHDAITAILPVTTQSLIELHQNLGSLLSTPPSILREIIIVCHPNIISRTEQAVKSIRNILHTSVVVTALHSSTQDSQSLRVLHTLPSVLTSRVLVLGTAALSNFDHVARMMLLGTAPSAVPVGPSGMIISSMNASCVHPGKEIVRAAYLVPPFLSPTLLLGQAENGMRMDVDTWAALGERVVKVSGAGYGGLVMMGASSLSSRWCTDEILSINRQSNSTFLKSFYKLLERDYTQERPSSLHIDVLLPDREDLEAFGPTLCEMAQRGSILRLILFSWSHADESTHFALDVGCHIHFKIIPRKSPTSLLVNELKGWMHAQGGIAVLVYASQVLVQTMAIETSVETLRLAGRTIVRLPLEDLAYCTWVSLLSLSEWKNWHKPRIDLSIITNNRPRSLSRLLVSLTSARYFGDTVHLKVNLEQTADSETRQIVAHLSWKAGVLHVQHRVKAAGLLPAVVEAWYPNNNDSYGVLLEDDVELSPMFYAWAKMAILKYRYGTLESHAHSLFGVSLYQPKNLELRVNGRVPFEPRMIFAEYDISNSHTPYLSQVPCSWGAVYFPEHFVEFHDYLALRLSGVTHDISAVIIPDIRSNRWKKSWKKYFNELVYLRGYVMLYPNYDLSLATNHVEVGAHVKSYNIHTRDSIRRQFEVPLMPLPLVSATAGTTISSLLDLPDNALPEWDSLPVLDLWGIVTSHKEIATRGQERHELVSRCPSLKNSTPFRYDATELLCTGRLVG